MDPRRRRHCGAFLGVWQTYVTDETDNFTETEKLTLTITKEAATCGEFGVFDTHLTRASTIDRASSRPRLETVNSDTNSVKM